jgi:hypothetical protein
MHHISESSRAISDMHHKLDTIHKFSLDGRGATQAFLDIVETRLRSI